MLAPSVRTTARPWLRVSLFPQWLCQPEGCAELVGILVAHDYLNGETIRMDGALRIAPR
jgi:hypothetical protein